MKPIYMSLKSRYTYAELLKVMSSLKWSTGKPLGAKTPGGIPIIIFPAIDDSHQLAVRLMHSEPTADIAIWIGCKVLDDGPSICRTITRHFNHTNDKVAKHQLSTFVDELKESNI